MIKQVIVIRQDLNMRRGKEIAQASHASMMFITKRLKPLKQTKEAFCYESVDSLVRLSEKEMNWLDNGFAKICVRVNSEDELINIHKLAQEKGIESNLVLDSGKTEFNGVPTLTCLAIGPDESELINQITGNLKLY